MANGSKRIVMRRQAGFWCSGFVVALCAVGAAWAQTRVLVPEEVAAARPGTNTAGGSAHGQYRPAGTTPGSTASSQREVGVTIWRLRHTGPADNGARILVQEESQTVEWTPERVSATSTLRAADRVRLTIESPEAGYLYVIDREKYASGERGEPYLIFPTTRTHGGDNKVAAGKLIDIPAQDDQPNFFTLRKSRPDQAEEELTVLLLSKPLEGITIGPKALALTNEQAGLWEKQWGAGRTEIFELNGGAGKGWTRAEQEAAANRDRILTQEDPPPQTVYRVSVGPGQPFLVKVRLRYQPK
jgi:hypothetical protein